MENFEDLKENVMQGIEDLCKMCQGEKRRMTYKELSEQLRFWATSTQEPIIYRKEAKQMLLEELSEISDPYDDLPDILLN